ncbi:MAG: hypothetical protein HN411_00080 [Waddliaceae bacterium]|jgi:hypothetical protein|nr:hypothetical protein [Waddliaceae bacterium]MBT3579026.1 hypothetical protein [Waddliaceae bacterium]MBT4444509.1 hypothetical protein [Waddliaceae bacterium]MBT6929168.1 hypothetical protein [Waddliaceae bacterium]MBT7264240.1 hypothetical protein [Waddliaceae bacterium]
MKKIFLLVLLLSSSFGYSEAEALGSLSGEIISTAEEELLCHKYFPSKIITLPVAPVIPLEYHVFPQQFEEELDIACGVYWGTPKDVKTIWENINQNKTLSEICAELESGVFNVEISMNTAQIDKDTFYGESEMPGELRKAGFKKINICKKKWGEYPVLVIDAVDENKKPISAAWVGLNYSGYTLVVTYIYPLKDVKKEKRKWSDFVNKTQILPRDKLLKASGYDIEKGSTVMTLSNCKIKTLSERKKSDGTMRLMVFPLTELTSVTISSIEKCFTEFSDEECVKVHLNVDSQADGYNVVTDCVVTANPKNVDDFSLIGETIKQSENVVVMKPATE